MAIAEADPIEVDELSYAPVSVTAVISIILAALSAGGTFTPLLLFLGPMALATSLMALHIIRKNDGAVRGRWLAVTALAMSTLFTCWASTRFASHQWWLYRHAETYVENWVRWVESDQLTKAYTHTAQAGAFNPTTGRASPLEGQKFFEQEPFKSMRGAKGELVLISRNGIIEGGGRTYVGLKYEYRLRDGDETRTLPLFVEVQRTWHSDTGRYEWFISDVH